MNILMLWHDLPSPVGGGSLPAFNLIRYLGQEHRITLVAFKDTSEESRYRYDLEQFCEFVDTVDIIIPKSLLKMMLYTIINTLSPKNIFSGNFSFFNLHYLPKMQNKIKHLLATRKFDIIYTSPFMPHFVWNVDIPKVAHLYDCLTETRRRTYRHTKNIAMKFFWWLQYLRIRWYERIICEKFDACIMVTEGEKKRLQSLFRNANVVVVPNGVDSEFYKPITEREEWPSLIFVGTMNLHANIDSILFFYNHIWGKIKMNIPETKLYIVGRDPTKEIQSLAKEPSIVVTGFVDDVRQYISQASVVIAPFTFAAGMKHKILEAMAMAKPVVSTSVGLQGINVTANEDVIIADEPGEFARRVVQLLTDSSLRQRIGTNGQKLVQSSYSWQHTARQIKDIFNRAVYKQINR